MGINMIVQNDTEKEFVDWAGALSRTGDLYIAGAGEFGRIIGRFLTEKKVSWKGYVDKRCDVASIEGKRVSSYADTFSEKDFFLISSYDYADEIVGELKKAEVSEDHIFVFPNIQDLVYGMYGHFVNWSSYTEKVKRFHNQYEEKRCFVVGNGPSLKVSDLDRLKDEITFGCNSIYAVYESTIWRPTFYFAWDTLFCETEMSEKEGVKRLLSGCKAMFSTIMREGFRFRDEKDIEGLFFVRAKNEEDEETGLPRFSEDCSKQVYISGTVSYFMLQMAVYMGFQEIYLLGIDASYSMKCGEGGTLDWEASSNNMDLLKKEEKKYTKKITEKYSYANMTDMVRQQMLGYEAAKKYAEMNEIKIYNATRGGKLEVFQRVEFESLF